MEGACQKTLLSFSQSGYFNSYIQVNVLGQALGPTMLVVRQEGSELPPGGEAPVAEGVPAFGAGLR